MEGLFISCVWGIEWEKIFFCKEKRTQKTPKSLLSVMVTPTGFEPVLPA
jgi:hypothetical protein